MPVRYFSTKDIETNSPQLQALGYIYDFVFEPSVSTNGDASLNLNIVNESGIYNTDLIKGMMSFQKYFKFDILGGAEKRGITLYAYLVGYSEDISSTSKTLRLQFKDGSHILDRVFVALLNKEVRANGLNSMPENEVFTKKILCNNCDILSEKNFLSVDFSQVRALNNASSPLMPPRQGHNVFGNSLSGGIILVGRETFTKSACEIPDIDFNFTELTRAARRIGIIIDIPDLFPFFRVKTGGKLKEVLGAFATRFGFSYRYDFTRNPEHGHYISAVEILHSSSQDSIVYRSINGVKKFAENYSPSEDDSPIVIGITDNESITSTVENYTAMRAQKNKEESTKTREVNYSVNLKSIKIRDIMSDKFARNRTEEQVMISASLKKYSPVARVLYNISIDKLSVLGLYSTGNKLDPKKVIAKLTTNITVDHNVIKTLTQWQLFFNEERLYDKGGSLKKIISFDEDLFTMYTANYSSFEEAETSKFEDEIINFLGKYYYSPVVHKTVEKVDGFLSNTSFSSKITPDVKDYLVAPACGAAPFPFEALMEGTGFSKNSPLVNLEKVSIFSRSPNFGGDDKTIKMFLENVTKSVEKDSCNSAVTMESIDAFANPLDLFKPVFFHQTEQESAAARAAHIDELEKRSIPGASPYSPAFPAAGSVDGRKGIFKAVTVLLPSAKLIKKLFEISDIEVVVHKKETDTFKLNNFKKEISKKEDNHCAAQENPIDYFDQQFILDPVSKQYILNPCYCGSALSVFFPNLTGDPKKESHAVGLISSFTSSFIIKLGKLFGASSQKIISSEPLREGELMVVLPCGSLFNASDDYAANYQETFTRSIYIPAVLSCANNFTFGVQASSINVFSEDISSLAFREYSDPRSYSQWSVANNQFPLEIQNPENAGFMPFLAYFSRVSSVNKNSSVLFPRKDLTLRLSATKHLGEFADFMNMKHGLSSFSIEKGEDSLIFVIKFQNTPPAKLERLSLVVERSKLGREF